MSSHACPAPHALQVHGAIYVVDASDASRLPESKEELQKVVDHPMVVGKPLLVYVATFLCPTLLHTCLLHCKASCADYPHPQSPCCSQASGQHAGNVSFIAPFARTCRGHGRGRVHWGRLAVDRRECGWPLQPCSIHCRLANKQDIPSSLTEADISAEMGLDKLTMCRHRVVPCVARPGSFGGKIDGRIWEGALAFGHGPTLETAHAMTHTPTPLELLALPTSCTRATCFVFPHLKTLPTSILRVLALSPSPSVSVSLFSGYLSLVDALRCMRQA